MGDSSKSPVISGSVRNLLTKHAQLCNRKVYFIQVSNRNDTHGGNCTISVVNNQLVQISPPQDNFSVVDAILVETTLPGAGLCYQKYINVCNNPAKALEKCLRPETGK